MVHAVDRVLARQNRNAFCLVRPPGHNVGCNGLLDPDGNCGFSIFNNVAAGAVYALEEHPELCQRVAIIDLDIHHGELRAGGSRPTTPSMLGRLDKLCPSAGNGTEEIVRRYGKPQQLLYFSMHLFDKDESFEMFPGTGELDDIAGNIINAPLLPLWKDPLILLRRLGSTRSCRS